MTKVSHRYGGCYSPDCWLPWGMSRALRRFTGTTYGALYDGFRKELSERYTAQKGPSYRRRLGRCSRSRLQAPTDVDRPLFEPDGQHLLWLESDPHRRPALMRHDLSTGARRWSF